MEPERLYHIYNRGNNKQMIYFGRNNYIFFLNKIKKHLLSYIDLLAYCLMPNHFHLLAYSKPDMNNKAFSNDLKIMLRSYARAINIQEDRSGSLFQQHTKIKPLIFNNCTHSMTLSHTMSYKYIDTYPDVCFHYIHQNPVNSGLVRKMEDWEFSSFRDYAGLRVNSVCNKALSYQFINISIDSELFISQSCAVKLN